MKRGDVFWVDLGPPAGRRPALVVTRTRALGYRTRVTVAPVTTTIRGIPSEVPLGPREGLRVPCVANCDDLATISVGSLNPEPAGSISARKQSQLDDALRFALGIAT